MHRLRPQYVSPTRGCLARRRFTLLCGERLEERALLAPLAGYQIHIVPPGASLWQPNLSSVNVGQFYDLAVTVEDLTQGGLGVAAGYLDIAYDSSLSQVQTAEVQRIAIGSRLQPGDANSTSGTFTLQFGDQDSGPILFNSDYVALTATIQAALSTLSNIGPGNVSVTSNTSSPFDFDVAFIGIFSNEDVPSLVVTSQSLIGPIVPVLGRIDATVSVISINDLATDAGRAGAFREAFRMRGSLFPHALHAEDLPNLINDVGGSCACVKGPGEYQLVRARMKAMAPGTLTFTPSVTDLFRPSHDTVLISPPTSLTPDQIDAGLATTLTIVAIDAIFAAGDAATVAEDSSGTAIDVLANDTVQPVGATKEVVSVVTQPASGSITFTAGSIAYTPAPNFSGTETFTYVARNTSAGAATITSTATVTVVVTPVNDAPSFAQGPNQSATDDAGPQSVAEWASAIADGPVNEAAQTLTFLVTNSDNGLFSSQPQIDSTGQLTYTPAPNAGGTATVTVLLSDSGGTVAGGNDTSAAQTFLIEVTRPFRWRNSVLPLNVDGSAGDSPVSPIDAVLVINYINNGGGAVPLNSSVGPPYRDVNGDNFVSPIDAVLVINYINSHPPVTIDPAMSAGEGESAPFSKSVAVDDRGIDELLMLIALDAAETRIARRRRS